MQPTVALGKEQRARCVTSKKKKSKKRCRPKVKTGTGADSPSDPSFSFGWSLAAVSVCAGCTRKMYCTLTGNITGKNNDGGPIENVKVLGLNTGVQARAGVPV